MRNSKTLQATMDQKFVVGFAKYFGKRTKVAFLDREYTSDQVTTLVQGLVDAHADVETARAQYAQAVAKAKAVRAQAKQTYDDAKQAVLYRYGNNPAVLSELGLAPRKAPRKPDVATKQAAILQSKATRAARHTMGSRQKAKIKGAVTPVSPDASVGPPAIEPVAAAPVGSNPPRVATAGVGITVTPTATTGH